MNFLKMNARKIVGTVAFLVAFFSVPSEVSNEPMTAPMMLVVTMAIFVAVSAMFHWDKKFLSWWDGPWLVIRYRARK